VVSKINKLFLSQAQDLNRKNRIKTTNTSKIQYQEINDSSIFKANAITEKRFGKMDLSSLKNILLRNNYSLKWVSDKNELEGEYNLIAFTSILVNTLETASESNLLPFEKELYKQGFSPDFSRMAVARKSRSFPQRDLAEEEARSLAELSEHR
jgi:hypothetical protein